MLPTKHKPCETDSVLVKNETDDKRSAKLSFAAQRARERRANQSPEQVAARRQKDAQRARERRAKLTAEQVAEQRQRDAILKRQRRARETEAEKAVRRSLEAQKARDRRAKLYGKESNRRYFPNRMELSHFMEVAEKTDLRCDRTINNPLGASSVTDWIKQEVDDDFSTMSEMCEAAFPTIPVKIELYEEPHTINLNGDGNVKGPPSQLKEDIKCGEKEATVSECNDIESNINSEKEAMKEGSAWNAIFRLCRRNLSYKSDVCGKLLSSKESVELHKMKQHLKEQPFNLKEYIECSEKEEDVVSGCISSGSNFNQDEETTNEVIDLSLVSKVRPKNHPYNCDVCGKLLSSKGNMRLHKIKQHGMKTPFFCKICNGTFDYRRELVRHRNEVHRRKLDGMFECSICGKVAYEFYNFLTHLKIHSKTNVTEERKKLEQTSQAFVCEQCGKVFKRLDSLKTHSMFVHLADGDIMAEKFRMQLQERNYVCDACGRCFALQCLLRDHLNIHSGIKPYCCPECNHTFAQRASLKQHLKTRGNIHPFPCPECKVAFFGRGDLKMHLRKHTSEKPFVCEVCGDAYAQNSHLNVHRRSNTRGRPFKCDVCGRGFTKSSDMIRHRRIHTGELPFLCQVCGKGFRQSAQCAIHIKNHHPESATS